jgi:tetratricopeptide (TPR) repeat protein
MSFIKAVLVGFSLTVCLGVHAGDSSPAEVVPAWLLDARKAVKAKNFDKAISVLQTANQTSSADWNNLMGYSQRKKEPADLDAAELHYQEALKIDPKHKGALEYYGQLLLLRSDLPGAEQLLARLDKACFISCEEYRDLKQAISAYKAKNQPAVK